MGKKVQTELLLKNTESFSIELLLLTYPLLLISADIKISPHYLLIALSIIAGIGLYIFLRTIPYTVQIGLLTSIFISVPLFLSGVSLAVTILVTIYVFWRIHTNFSAERHARWNFIAINTIVFTTFYFITSIYLLQPKKTLINEVNVVLFISTTILYIFYRYFVVLAIGKGIPNFQFRAVHKMFGGILSIGAVTFVGVYFFMESFRSAILGILSMLFGNLFKTASLIPDSQLPNQEFSEEEFLEEEMLEIPTSSDQANLGTFLTILAVVIAIVFIIILLKKQKLSINILKMPSYSIHSFRPDKNKESKNQHLSYSPTTNAVRSAYQDFERAADLAKSSKFTGETMKEWFMRMDWEEYNHQTIKTYDKARYGSLTIPEEESRQFVETLNKIKINNFNKNV